MPEDYLKQISDEILKSKKYKDIYRPTVESIVADCIRRYPLKDVEKEARNKLHQIWGAFGVKTFNNKKLLETVKKKKTEKIDYKDILATLLLLHSSTKERIKFLPEFYSKIFEVTGKPESILDIACGFNPLTFEWMNLPETTEYFGFDISESEMVFVNDVLKVLHPHNSFHIYHGDVLIDFIPQAHVTFVFKTLQVLEQQKKGISIDILSKIKGKFIVVSFPTKSLGGKEKGMKDFYSKEFETHIKSRYKFDKLEFDNEVVYVLDNKLLSI